ncbi:MAG: hypothetical protein ACN6OS_11770 [Comamonas testosteroni]|uniref:hypothetical protein n=1 Tax=Comamonas testosteroni TaxID=285 RepID=UPI003D113C45
MFFLPLILVPIVFLMALVRLYQIPVQLRSGRLRLVERGRPVLRLATVLAYAGLLVGSAALLAALVYASLFSAQRWASYLHLAPYLALYPFLYLAAAWVFYYGLKKSAAD